MTKHVLVIAEKPSVAANIASAIGAYQERDGYYENKEWLISWCLGHLAEYADPERYDEKYSEWNFEDLPIIPDPWRMNVMRDKKKQYTLLKELLHRSDVVGVINACDAGREGELIFRRAYELAKCSLPVRRLWISSMESQAIREGLRSMKDGREFDNLAAASVCRAKADWLIGINDSRAFTTTYGRRLVLGRVQTPTLAMLVERESSIEHFQKEQFFLVHLRKGRLDAVSEKYMNRADADAVAASCNGQDALVKYVQSEQKKVSQPKLYDLTALQRDANRMFGLTASQTLETAQALYEAKLLTYPRTDSRYLTEDMEQTVRSVLTEITEAVPFAGSSISEPDIKRVMNSKKVSDHHAIIPTVEIGKTDFDKLPDRDRKVLFLVIARLLCSTGKPHTYTQTTALIECQGVKFGAQGKRVDDPGWKAFEESLKAYCKADEPNTEQEEKGIDTFLTDVHEGEIIPAVTSDVTDHWTQPPKHFTEDSLLSAMERAGAKEMDDDVERKGLGTPATRASMIEKLISSGYAVRKKKQLLPTDEGKLLISLVPEYLKSASMTADWENRLLAMERGQDDPQRFMEDITAQLIYTIEECRQIPEDVRNQFRSKPAKGREPVGDCPVCGSPVYEGGKVFFCSDDDCDFCLWKNNRYLEGMRKKLTRDMAIDLLADRRTYVKGLYSQKKDKTFSADLVMDIKDGRAEFSLEFPKKKEKV